MYRGYKYELKVNNKERTLLAMYAGTARFAWNWGLAQRLKRYKENEGQDKYTDAMKQHQELNGLKASEFAWMYQVSKCVPQEALRDLQTAFDNFLADLKNRRATGSKPKYGFPKFKKKGKCKDSFRLTGTIKVFSDEKLVQLPRLKKLRLKEKPNLHPSARILSATVSRTANRWYVSLGVREEPPALPEKYCAPDTVVGLDAGLAKFMTLSHGLYVPQLQFLQRSLRKLRRLSKAHSRKKNGSNNRKKSAMNLARFQRRVANSRRNFHHKLSHYLVKSHDVIVLEDLHLKGLIRNKKLSSYWVDQAHGELQKLISYKGKKYGTTVIKADRWFPSSKLCSNCLMIHPHLTLQDRTFTCSLCGQSLDRDYNAAINLAHYYYMFIHPKFQSVAESSTETLNACGESVRPPTGGTTRRSRKKATKTATSV
ncbi:MAG: RNA-guided endonuclease InsQ/TnpB family protein [Candidatus Hermodarchaeota archaeon]